MDPLTMASNASGYTDAYRNFKEGRWLRGLGDVAGSTFMPGYAQRGWNPFTPKWGGAPHANNRMGAGWFGGPDQGALDAGLNQMFPGSPFEAPQGGNAQPQGGNNPPSPFDPWAVQTGGSFDIPDMQGNGAPTTNAPTQPARGQMDFYVGPGYTPGYGRDVTIGPGEHGGGVNPDHAMRGAPWYLF